jgi:hypothetical protein
MMKQEASHLVLKLIASPAKALRNRFGLAMRTTDPADGNNKIMFFGNV